MGNLHPPRTDGRRLLLRAAAAAGAAAALAGLPVPAAASTQPDQAAVADIIKDWPREAKAAAE